MITTCCRTYTPGAGQETGLRRQDDAGASPLVTIFVETLLLAEMRSCAAKIA